MSTNHIHNSTITETRNDEIISPGRVMTSDAMSVHSERRGSQHLPHVIKPTLPSSFFHLHCLQLPDKFFSMTPLRMIRMVWCFCVLLVALAGFSVALPTQLDSKEEYLHSNVFQRQLKAILFASMMISIPISIDFLLSFTTKSLPVTKEREYGRWNVLFDILLPSCLFYFEWLPLVILDLVVFYQYVHILLIVIHRISTISSLLQLPNTIATSFKQIYLGIMILCLIAFLYHYSLHSTRIGSKVMWKVIFSSIFVICLMLITYRLANYFRIAAISHAKAQNSISYGVWLTHAGSLMVVGFLHVILYPLDVVFFPYHHASLLLIEIYFIFMMVVISATKNYDIRQNEYTYMQQLEFNRKMTRSISHEIRTPLNTAFMGLDLLMSSLDNHGEEEEGDAWRDLEKGLNSISRNISSDEANVSVHKNDDRKEPIYTVVQSNGQQLSVDISRNKNKHSVKSPHKRAHQKYQQKSNLLEIAHTIKEGCNISLNILNQLLTFEKLQAGMMELEPSLIPVLDVIDSNALLFKMQAQQIGIQLVVAVSHDDREKYSKMQLFADEHKLNQVIRNLLSNAMKFTSKGGYVSIQASFQPLASSRNSMVTSNEPHIVACGSSFNCTGKNSRVQVISSEMSMSYSRRPAISFDHDDHDDDNENPFTHDLDKVYHQDVNGAKPAGFFTLSIIDSGPGISKVSFVYFLIHFYVSLFQFLL